MAEFGKLNEIYVKFFGSHRPARATVAVKELGLGGRAPVSRVTLTAIVEGFQRAVDSSLRELLDQLPDACPGN